MFTGTVTTSAKLVHVGIVGKLLGRRFLTTAVVPREATRFSGGLFESLEKGPKAVFAKDAGIGSRRKDQEEAAVCQGRIG